MARTPPGELRRQGASRSSDSLDRRSRRQRGRFHTERDWDDDTGNSDQEHSMLDDDDARAAAEAAESEEAAAAASASDGPPPADAPVEPAAEPVAAPQVDDELLEPAADDVLAEPTPASEAEVVEDEPLTEEPAPKPPMGGESEVPEDLLEQLGLEPFPLQLDYDRAAEMLGRITSARRIDVSFPFDIDTDDPGVTNYEDPPRSSRWWLQYDSIIAGDFPVVVALEEHQRRDVNEEPQRSISGELLRYVMQLLPAFGLASRNDVESVWDDRAELPGYAVARVHALVEGRESLDSARMNAATRDARRRAERTAERQADRRTDRSTTSRRDGGRRGGQAMVHVGPSVEDMKQYLLKQIKQKGITDLQTLAKKLAKKYPAASEEDMKAALKPVIVALRNQ